MVLDHRSEQLSASLGRLRRQLPAAEHLVGDLRARSIDVLAYLGEQAGQATSHRQRLFGTGKPELYAGCTPDEDALRRYRARRRRASADPILQFPPGHPVGLDIRTVEGTKNGRKLRDSLYDRGVTGGRGDHDRLAARADRQHAVFLRRPEEVYEQPVGRVPGSRSGDGAGARVGEDGFEVPQHANTLTVPTSDRLAASDAGSEQLAGETRVSSSRACSTRAARSRSLPCHSLYSSAKPR